MSGESSAIKVFFMNESVESHIRMITQWTDRSNMRTHHILMRKQSVSYVIIIIRICYII